MGSGDAGYGGPRGERRENLPEAPTPARRQTGPQTIAVPITVAKTTVITNSNTTPTTGEVARSNPAF